MPGSDVRIDTTTGGLVLHGQVATPADADEAMSMARRFVASGQHVDNALTVLGSTQVTLRVRIAEMSRTVVRALGVNWQALGTVGRFAVNLATNNALSAAASGASMLGLGYRGAVNVNAVIDALAQNDLVHVLAEPNLTAMSGQTASFLVGGEFPIPVGQQNGQITVEFKKFGVSLAFVPTVLSSGRISLRVEPEVSQLSSQGAVQVTAGSSSLSIPALTVRRAETTVELGSGQSFAIAGLLQDSTDNNVSGLPGLGEIPILGALFRSNSFQHNQTELGDRGNALHRPPGRRSGGDQAADRRLLAPRRSATPATAASGRQRGHGPARPPAGRYRVHRAMKPEALRGDPTPSPPLGAERAGERWGIRAAAWVRAWFASVEPSPRAPTSPNPLRPPGRRGKSLTDRRRARAMLAAAALLAGCEQHPARYDNNSGEWHPNGANAANLAAMVADPLDLVRGHGDPGSDGAEAADAVRRLRTGQVAPVAASIMGSGGTGAGLGAGMGAASGGSTTGN